MILNFKIEASTQLKSSVNEKQKGYAVMQI